MVERQRVTVPRAATRPSGGGTEVHPRDRFERGNIAETARLQRDASPVLKLERVMGFEPTTSTLATLRSTPELHPLGDDSLRSRRAFSGSLPSVSISKPFRTRRPGEDRGAGVHNLWKTSEEAPGERRDTSGRIANSGSPLGRDSGYWRRYRPLLTAIFASLSTRRLRSRGL